jgi:hypothetical protein
MYQDEHADGGDMFLRNVGSYKNHTASTYPRIQHPSKLISAVLAIIRILSRF